MTAEHIDAWAQLTDALLAMGFSVLLWFCYHVMILIFPMRHRATAYLLHLLFFGIAGLFAFCFVIGRTSLGVVRWYLAAGFAAGAAAYKLCFAPAVNWTARMIRRACRLAARPFVRLWEWLVRRPFAALRLRLQKRRELRYNLRMEKKRARQDAPEKEEKDGGDTAGQKKPLQAYTQT